MLTAKYLYLRGNVDGTVNGAFSQNLNLGQDTRALQAARKARQGKGQGGGKGRQPARYSLARSLEGGGGWCTAGVRVVLGHTQL